MKKSIFIFLLVLISFNLYSQDLTKINIKEYKLDSKITSILVEETKVTKPLNIYQENNFIYVLGWSKDGKLAFILDKGVDGRGGSDLYFTIQDMVEDVNVYYKKIKWYDNDNYGENPELAQTFEECIKNNSKEFNSELKKYKIILNPVKVEFLPAVDKKGTVIDFKIVNSEKYIGEFSLSHMDYEIIAIKNNKYKLLSKIENKLCAYVIPTAFIKSPHEDRIALIVANAEYVFEGEEVFIKFYGCNLNFGFTNEIK
jgi:hypothetical protein